MAAPDTPFSPLHLSRHALVIGLLGLAGCQMGARPDSVPSVSGVQSLQGLAQNVSVRRNAQGMPLIESSSFHDGLFSLGYVHASDRLEQMIAMRLLAQGRLAELAGPEALDIDRLMRAAGLKPQAERLYADASPRLKRFFEVYARGVNAYLFRYRDRLPGSLAGLPQRPEYWKAEDSALLFSLYAFSQSVNLNEELGALALARQVGWERLPWLLPGAPDEPVALAEAEKLRGLDMARGLPGVEQATLASQQLAALGLLGNAGSSALALAPAHSRNGKSLLTSESRAAWAMSPVQLHSSKYRVAGLSLPGVPIVLAGFNGSLAWSASAVMADDQDLFLERLRRQGNQLTYLADGKWLPASARSETFFVRGQRPVREVMYGTRHGTLLGHPDTGLGLALQRPRLDGDRSLDALFDLTRATRLEKAFDSTRDVGSVALNFVFAEAGHIGWQVSGRFPNRREGLGLLPSPGWEGRYDWDGYADAMLHPYDQDPPSGVLAHANQRSQPKGYGMQLSNSWFYPQRAERLSQLASQGRFDARGLMALHNDNVSLLATRLAPMLEAPGMAQPLQQAIQALPVAQRALAQQALQRLKAFDGRLDSRSADAALYGLFLQALARETFLDELGPEQGAAWQAFTQTAQWRYSAQADHLLGRDDSPFWQDRAKSDKRDKPTVLARSLARAMEDGQAQLGQDLSRWQWGQLHTYRWSTPPLPGLGDDVKRASQPASGDFSTVALTPYAWGRDFATTLPASARLVVDFGQAEPLQVLTSSGQSGNPASPHFGNALDAWFAGRYSTLPLEPQHFTQAYGSTRLTLVPAR